MLTAEQKQFFADNGYVVVRGLLTPTEAALYRQESHDLAHRLSAVREIDATWGSADAAAMGKKTQLLHCHDVHLQSAAFSRLLLHDRLTGVAADLIGPNVQLHHSKMFIKPPEKGSPFPMHQDAPFFPHENHSMIAAVLHFDDAGLEKGCLRVVPGSHKRGLMPHLPEGSWHLPTDEYPVSEAMPLEAKAGDAVFFSYLTIHGSGLNESSEARTTLLIQMRDPEDAPSYRTHESPGQGMMLRGLDPTCATRPALDRTPGGDGTFDAPNGSGASPVSMGGATAGAMDGSMAGKM
jgi:phytanoyl-CoA hydroxylase